MITVYTVGSAKEDIWSDTYIFKTMKEGSDWSPHIALYGDFGFSNHQSLKRLMIDNDQGLYDAIFHVGKSEILVVTKVQILKVKVNKAVSYSLEYHNIINSIVLSILLDYLICIIKLWIDSVHAQKILTNL